MVDRGCKRECESFQLHKALRAERSLPSNDHLVKLAALCASLICEYHLCSICNPSLRRLKSLIHLWFFHFSSSVFHNSAGLVCFSEGTVTVLLLLDRKFERCQRGATVIFRLALWATQTSPVQICKSGLEQINNNNKIELEPCTAL